VAERDMNRRVKETGKRGMEDRKGKEVRMRGRSRCTRDYEVLWWNWLWNAPL